jgi:nucleoside triphosphate pyrophosphatase
MCSQADAAPIESRQLILASASPRRRELLAQLALPFSVMPANIEERQLPDEPPRTYVVRMAQSKAAHLAQQYPDALVLGADTIVVLDNHILGKPENTVAAHQMLQRLSGRQHTVITGVALLQQRQQFLRLDMVSTLVRFRPLLQTDIERYVATGEPFDKAGAYAIQGGAAAFVVSVEGCYTNVVGLPLRRTAALLRSAGLGVPYDTGA